MTFPTAADKLLPAVEWLGLILPDAYGGEVQLTMAAAADCRMRGMQFVMPHQIGTLLYENSAICCFCNTASDVIDVSARSRRCRRVLGHVCL